MLKHKILRQPVRYAVGVLIILLAVSVLCVTVGQGMYAVALKREVEENYTTIALPGIEVQPGDTSRYDEITAFLEETARQYPGLVRGRASIGLASAYVPELSPLNQTAFLRGKVTSLNGNYDALSQPDGAPYCAAMLEMTLADIAEPVEEERGFTVELMGKVDRVISLQEGYSDPTDFRLRISLAYTDEVELENLALVVGERYLVYSPEYVDMEYLIRNAIAYELEIDLPKELKPECFRIIDPVKGPLDYNDWPISIRLNKLYIDLIQTAEMKIFIGEDVAWMDDPTFALLEGSAEEFLASEQATQWRAALERIKVNHHAFPIIGVDRLEHVAEFARGNAEIIEGRSFTPEELESGAKVCVISYDLAQANGIGLGDTLSTSFYSHVENMPYQRYLCDGIGVVKPAAYFYTAASQMEEPEVYTVVGIYRQHGNPWGFDGENPYAFTPNVIFVPYTSVAVLMEEPGQGMFYAIELENGAIGAFEELVAQSELEVPFGYFDGGYSTIAPSLEIFRETASRAVLVGVAVYGVLLLLYLLLFPAQEKKTLRTMNSLGAPRKTRFAYLLTTVLGTLLPGTLLGMGLGAALWGVVAQKMLEHSGAAFTVELNVTQFMLVGLAQLLFALLLSVVLALCMIDVKDFWKKK